MKKAVVLRSSHLHKYLKSLALAISGRKPEATILDCISLALEIKANFEHVHLQVTVDNLDGHPARPQLEEILSSPFLKSVTLDIRDSSPSILLFVNPPPPPFPQWIFQSISTNVSKLDVTATAEWEPPSSASILEEPEKRPQRKPWYPEDVSIDLYTSFRTPGERLAAWATGLGEPWLNWKFSRAKKLTITTESDDASLWALPDDARETLEELSITGLPSEWSNVNLNCVSSDLFPGTSL
jgi:hypothetical protein